MVRSKSYIAYVSCVFAFVAACCLQPVQAHALFYDYSSADPFGGAASRSQDSWNALIGSMGEPLIASDIPDGTYNIDVTTTSTMCWIYPSASDCAGRIQDSSWGHAVLTVSGDSMVVHFYVSQAYTYLRWGTAYEAASASSEDGLSGDGSYIPGSPSEGYVPHYFALQIPALNWVMDIATYGGNDADFASSQWWHRFIAFKATDEIYNAISGTTPSDDPTPVNPTPSGGGGSSYSRIIDDINAQIAQNGQSGASGGADPNAAASATGTQSALAALGKTGVHISGVTFDQSQAAAAPDGSSFDSDGARPHGLSIAQILLLVCLAFGAAGAGIHTYAFAAGKR